MSPATPPKPPTRTSLSGSRASATRPAREDTTCSLLSLASSVASWRASPVPPSNRTLTVAPPLLRPVPGLIVLQAACPTAQTQPVTPSSRGPRILQGLPMRASEGGNGQRTDHDRGRTLGHAGEVIGSTGIEPGGGLRYGWTTGACATAATS